MKHESLEPISIGSIELKNRIVFGSCVNNLGLNDEITDRQISFYAARARGGVGGIVTEGMSVHRTSIPNPTVPLAYEKSLIPKLTLMANEVHKSGTMLFGQLWHVGRQALWNPSLIPWSVSGDRDPYSGSTPHVMNESEIEEVIQGFVSSAVNLAEAGFDGVELHGAHGYLITQFLSSASNHRDDKWGGSVENRVRFVEEIIKGIRKAVDPKFVVGLKLAAHEFVDGGIDLEDARKLVSRLVAVSPPDYIATGQGNFSPSLEKHVPDMHFEDAPFIGLTEGIKQVSAGVPVMALSKVPNIEAADQIVRSGSADLVGMVRALLADADLVVKTSNNLSPRPCVYCNVCWKYIHTGRPVACMYGPSTGREVEVVLNSKKPQKPKEVHVVGGGPAGMEFARVAADLGHNVTLYERSAQLGGRLNSDAEGSERDAIKEAVHWFEQELARLKVRVILNKEVDLTSLDKLSDFVVVATGAQPVVSLIPGADTVISLEEAQSNVSALVGPVFIIDEVEGEPVYAVAELIAQAGKKVSIVTRRASIGRHVAYVDIIGVFRRLDQLNVDIYPMNVPLRVESGHMKVKHALSGNERDLGEVKTIVQAGPYQAPHLVVDGAHVLVVGDASAPREILAIVREANDLANQHLG